MEINKEKKIKYIMKIKSNSEVVAFEMISGWAEKYSSHQHICQTLEEAQEGEYGRLNVVNSITPTFAPTNSPCKLSDINMSWAELGFLNPSMVVAFTHCIITSCQLIDADSRNVF